MFENLVLIWCIVVGVLMIILKEFIGFWMILVVCGNVEVYVYDFYSLYF